MKRAAFLVLGAIALMSCPWDLKRDMFELCQPCTPVEFESQEE